MIATGALVAYLYLSRQLKRHHGLPAEQSQNLFLLIVAAAFVGGKLLYYLEDPGRYLSNPGEMFRNMGNGFVFYGSLLAAVPVVVLFARRHRIPLMPFLDHIAITACLVHAFGRLGCFGAGCCYGLPTDAFWGVVYEHPLCMAKPLGQPLHPTQLYSAGMILSVLAVLLLVARRKRFHGQLFLLYILLYAAGRAVIENFRGDLHRGFVFDGWLSHSQLISLLLMAGVGGLYFYLWKNRRLAAPQADERPTHR
jgi:phosphatidylglycerol:prolipoprotein diacylglycerol transferase